MAIKNSSEPLKGEVKPKAWEMVVIILLMPGKLHKLLELPVEQDLEVGVT